MYMKYWTLNISLYFYRAKSIVLIGVLGMASFSAFSQTDQINYRSWVRTKTDNSTEKKIALVIGNSEYQHGAKLKEPAQDAQTIAAALEAQGYEVELGYNLDRQSFNQAIEDFSQKFRTYESGIVYYAGHGFQIDGENYLIPIDANPESKFQVHSQCINVDHFFRSFNQPEKAKVVILDACRNNPFVQNRNWTAEYRGTTNGMTEISPMTNSLLIFSTEKNTVVRDDNQFTEILSKHIRQGGCMSNLLGNVSREVRELNPDQRIVPVGVLEKKICFGDNSENQQSRNPDLMDSDNDLIPDKIDKCPNEYGSLENEGCPGSKSKTLNEGDNDRDGIANVLDKCPEEAGPLDNDGCPNTEYIGPFDNGTFTDERDESEYFWVRLKDGNKWMSQNLNYKANDSWCYQDKKKNCSNGGRLYSWDSAQAACPNGWHLPSEQEWQSIINIYGGEREAYASLMIKGEHSFNPELSGGRQMEGDFCCRGDFGNYWSSSSSSAKATYLDINKTNGYIALDKYSKKWGLSCRCIAD